MLNRLIFIIVIILPNQLFSQVEKDRILDKRDGRIYQTVKIDNVTWFYDNLKYETNNSFYPSHTKKPSNYKNGNYYTNKNLEKVCPTGWEIPTEKDWIAYFEYRMKEQGGDISSIYLDTLQEEYISLIYRDSSKKLNLFEASNPLDLDEYGWVEGKKIRDWGTTTFWIKHTEIKDNRFHIHLENEKYVVHRHKHNIEDKKKKQRKFLVKCIKRDSLKTPDSPEN